MTTGPVFAKILRFSLPLAGAGILQRLFNAADMVIVGRYAGSFALAAVGATGTISNLLVDTFIGFSLGTNILVAHLLGERDDDKVSSSVYCAFILGLAFGVIMMLIGIGCAKTLLLWTNVPAELLAPAGLYLRICFCGAPFMLIYNFCAAVLRAKGDTQRPLLFLFLSGVLNILLNLLLVIGFQLGVAGVAIATVFSQFLAALLVVFCLLRDTGPCRLGLKRSQFDWGLAIKTLHIGLPAGLQGAAFSFANMVIHTSLNSFGPTVIAANSAACSIYIFTYTVMNAVAQAAITFTSQNCGAKRFDHLPLILRDSLIMVCSSGLMVGTLVFLFRAPLLNLFIPANTPDYQAFFAAGSTILAMVNIPYFLCGILEVYSGMVRGMGHSILPMLVSILGICALRIFWVRFVFPTHPTLVMLLTGTLISWCVTGIVHFTCYCVLFWRLRAIP